EKKAQNKNPTRIANIMFLRVWGLARTGVQDYPAYAVLELLGFFFSPLPDRRCQSLKTTKVRAEAVTTTGNQTPRVCSFCSWVQIVLTFDHPNNWFASLQSIFLAMITSSLFAFGIIKIEEASVQKKKKHILACVVIYLFSLLVNIMGLHTSASLLVSYKLCFSETRFLLSG
ncbi:hypothetical protein ACJX0J_010852, partial [Zea mays]